MGLFAIPHDSPAPRPGTCTVRQREPWTSRGGRFSSGGRPFLLLHGLLLGRSLGGDRLPVLPLSIFEQSPPLGGLVQGDLWHLIVSGPLSLHLIWPRQPCGASSSSA